MKKGRSSLLFIFLLIIHGRKFSLDTSSSDLKKTDLDPVAVFHILRIDMAVGDSTGDTL